MSKENFNKNKNFSKNLGNLGTLVCEYIIKAQNPHQNFLNGEKTDMNDKCLVVNQFKKKVRVSLYNLRVNIYNSEIRKSNNSPLTEEKFIREEGIYDTYNFLENTVVVMDFKMTIKNDLLYEVLSSMEQQQRNIVYLSLCKDMSDKKIGEKLKLSRSSVQRIKQSMKKRIYDAMTGGSKHED